MQRPAVEVARSQARMIDRRGTEGMDQSLEASARSLQEHRQQVRVQLEREKHFEVLDVPYPELIRNPGPVCERIAEFVGDRLPHPDLMAQVIKPDLYRQKAARGKGGEAGT